MSARCSNPRCNAQTPPGAEFCPRCGAHLVIPAQVLDPNPEVLEVQPIPTYPPPTRRPAPPRRPPYAYPPPPPPPQVVYVQSPPVQIVYTDPPRPKWNPGVAALLSFFFPGVGQIYKGQTVNGIVWMIAVVFGYMLLVIPGIVLHICCVVGASSGDPYK